MTPCSLLKSLGLLTQGNAPFLDVQISLDALRVEYYKSAVIIVKRLAELNNRIGLLLRNHLPKWKKTLE